MIDIIYSDKKKHTCLDAFTFFKRHNTLLILSIFSLFLSIPIGIFLTLIAQVIMVGREALDVLSLEILGPDPQEYGNHRIYCNVMIYSCWVSG